MTGIVKRKMPNAKCGFVYGTAWLTTGRTTLLRSHRQCNDRAFGVSKVLPNGKHLKPSSSSFVRCDGELRNERARVTDFGFNGIIKLKWYASGFHSHVMYSIG